MNRVITLALSIFLLTACNQEQDKKAEKTKPETQTTTATSPAVINPEEKLAEILSAQPADVKARFDARHPQQTLTFFGLKPGMTVVEALPGQGWYSKILLDFLGKNGQLIGADYAADMYPRFGFFSPEVVESKKNWVETWRKEAEAWRGDNSAQIGAFQFGTLPEAMKNSADAVLFIRALHNLARFEKDGAYLTSALSDAYQVLKPGGVVGVVQHMAPERASDTWSNGSHGYLKRSFVIQRMEKAGFQYAGSTDVNFNPKDKPTEDDVVWRLPPTLSTSEESPELKKQYQEIGESSRMTLLFIKPQS